MALEPCPGCPAAYASAPATVRHDGNGVWRRVPDETRAHLVALFRDPQIQAGRRIEVVLDLAPEAAHCRVPRWLGPLLRALARLPVGLTVALDNGVRCPCGKAMGQSTYFARASLCLERTRAMVTARRHPDGGHPGIVICDRDLTDAFAAAETLSMRSGAPWVPPKRWIAAVGTEVTFFGQPALVLAHPMVVQRHRAYQSVVEDALPRLVSLARAP